MPLEKPITMNPSTGEPETKFRERVRDLLDLDWSTRDENIFSELRRLKNVDERVNQMVAASDTV